MSRNARRRLLVYVNQVYPDDYSGQGTFERELVHALRERVYQHEDMCLRVFSVRRPGNLASPHSDTTLLPLDKSRPASYLLHQVFLFVALVWTLGVHWRDDITIYGRYAPSSLAPVLVALLFGRRFVIRTGPVMHNLTPFGRNPGRATYLAVRFGFWLNCRRANAIVVVTTTTRRVIERYFTFAHHKMVVVPNGANLAHFRPQVARRDVWGLAEDRLVLGFVGFVFADQGVDTVIRALGRLDRGAGCADAPQFLVVGDGPCLSTWKTLTRDLGVNSHVVFAGQRAYAEIPSAIAACDVMVAPFTRESFNTIGSSALKLFEYLACDKPVLASRAADHQFLADCDIGDLVEPDDVEAWAAAIRALMLAPKWTLGGRGRRLVEDHYSFTRVGDEIFSVCFPRT